MVRLVLSLCFVVLLWIPGLPQDQVSREIPLKHLDAVQIAGVFGGEPQAKPGARADASEAFMARCLERSLGSSSAGPGLPHYYLESESGTAWGGDGAAAAGTLSTLLPRGLAGPPKANLVRNSLLVTGPEEEISKVEEVVGLLDRPLKPVGLQVEMVQMPVGALDRLGAVGLAEGEEKQRVLRLARQRFEELMDDSAADCLPTRLSSTVNTVNNWVAEVRLGQIRPYWWAEKEGDKPQRRAAAWFIQLRLVPRINADASVTMLVDSTSISGEAIGGQDALLASKLSQTLTTQVRAGSGDTVLITGLHGAQEDSTGMLTEPILAITPRLLSQLE